MTILTTIPNGASFKDIRDTLNALILDVTGLKGGTVTPSLTGFYANGATNAKLLAALQGVKAGTRRAKIVWKGDSTSVGEGGGTGTLGLIDARKSRPSFVVAGLLTAAGVPTFDEAVFGTHGVSNFASNVTLAQYDPRINQSTWNLNEAQDFSGGGLLASANGSDPITITPTGTFDRYEFVYYRTSEANRKAYFAIGTGTGVFPDTGPGSEGFTALGGGSGFGNFVYGMNAARSPLVGQTSASTALAIRSWRPFNTALPAIDILNHASRGAKSADQASSSASNWNNLDALKYDAPDLTVINLGLNDMNTGVSADAYRASLLTIITAAKISGDVLLLFPHPASGSFNNNVAAFHAAAKQLAADQGIAFFSIYEYLGAAFTSALAARMFDGAAHPKAELYAEIGQRITDAIKRMAPAAF